MKSNVKGSHLADEDTSQYVYVSELTCILYVQLVVSDHLVSPQRCLRPKNSSLIKYAASNEYHTDLYGSQKPKYYDGLSSSLIRKPRISVLMKDSPPSNDQQINNEYKQNQNAGRKSEQYETQLRTIETKLDKQMKYSKEILKCLKEIKTNCENSSKFQISNGKIQNQSFNTIENVSISKNESFNKENYQNDEISIGYKKPTPIITVSQDQSLSVMEIQTPTLGSCINKIKSPEVQSQNDNQPVLSLGKTKNFKLIHDKPSRKNDTKIPKPRQKKLRNLNNLNKEKQKKKNEKYSITNMILVAGALLLIWLLMALQNFV